MNRQKIHLSPQSGWMNDPNGLIYYKGKYHAFYQHYPHAPHWGSMHWGHAVSDDLLYWQHMPIALTPGDAFDKDGCFSGSALEYNGKLYLMYTGFIENGGGENIRQVQCLAESEDGISFTKYAGNPVIGSDMLPGGYNKCDFRDPKVWQREGVFYALIAARKIGGGGSILLYSSANLFDWVFVGDLGVKSPGSMIECPDYIESQNLLLFSEQFCVQEGFANANIHTSLWQTGKLDYKSGKFTADKQETLDYGFDYYAPQSVAGLNETIVFGWMNMWDRSYPSAEYGWAGMFTSARRLTVEGGRVVQCPIDKIINAPDAVSKNYEGFDGVLEDEAGVCRIKLRAEGAKELKIELKSDGKHMCKIYTEAGALVFDRSKSGKKVTGAENNEFSQKDIRKLPLDQKDDIELLIVIDNFSVEVFCEGRALSAAIYPVGKQDKIKIKARADKLFYSRADV